MALCFQNVLTLWFQFEILSITVCDNLFFVFVCETFTSCIIPQMALFWWCCTLSQSPRFGNFFRMFWSMTGHKKVLFMKYRHHRIAFSTVIVVVVNFAYRDSQLTSTKISYQWPDVEHFVVKCRRHTVIHLSGLVFGVALCPGDLWTIFVCLFFLNQLSYQRWPVIISLSKV